jgi:hypothetical protein
MKFLIKRDVLLGVFIAPRWFELEGKKTIIVEVVLSD